MKAGSVSEIDTAFATIGVRDRKEAFAPRAAKIEIDNGNYQGAYQAMREFAEPGSAAMH